MTKTATPPIPETLPVPEPAPGPGPVIDAWFDGHVRPMAHRFTADVYNDLLAAKDALKTLF